MIIEMKKEEAREVLLKMRDDGYELLSTLQEFYRTAEEQMLMGNMAHYDHEIQKCRKQIKALEMAIEELDIPTVEIDKKSLSRIFKEFKIVDERKE